ncbi:AAA family ATPase [Variovorax sp. HW608]|uniref:AAA family ATPase n=1 Tax=Variovorax sp. HW608 TaxID=1034889 RepID=UPI000B5ADFF4|nr:AAA family ATPase [Variovorax sp. HW608]
MAKHAATAEVPPEGFGLHLASYHVEDTDTWVRFLLPQPVLSRMREELKRLNEQAQALEAERIEEKRSKAVARSGDELDRFPAEVPEQPPNTVEVFDWAAARARIVALKKNPDTGDSDVVRHDLRQFSDVMTRGPWRAVAHPPFWREALTTLSAEMPHFAEVVAFYERSLALAELTGSAPKPGPVLLLGSPGVGKTHFTERLAKVLGTSLYRQAFDNAQSNAGLRGSERYWSNSQVGALWQTIVLGEFANPIVLLDELDKASERNGHGSPTDALLTLLEPATAGCTKDVSMDFEFDASYAMYIATANDPARLSAPLRSRFTAFEIQEPDIEGRLVLAHTIYEATMARMVPDEKIRLAFRRPTNLQFCALAWMTPRQMRKASENALGAAALARRWHFEDGDFELQPRCGSADAASPRKDHDDDDGSIVAIVLRP